jgi:hypothetical protein
MEILPEIITLSNEMIDTLDEAEFFEGNPFIERLPLKRKLQITMQRKWEEQFEMHLTDVEFEKVVKETLDEAVSNTIEDLIDKGAIDMSIGKDGDVLYSINKDFDTDEL